MFLSLSACVHLNLVCSEQAECVAPEMKKRLEGILHILERKHRLDQRVRSISSRAGPSANKASPKSANNVSSAAPFELMQTFMKHLNGSGRACEHKYEQTSEFKQKYSDTAAWDSTSTRSPSRNVHNN